MQLLGVLSISLSFLHLRAVFCHVLPGSDKSASKPRRLSETPEQNPNGGKTVQLYHGRKRSAQQGSDLPTNFTGELSSSLNSSVAPGGSYIEPLNPTYLQTRDFTLALSDYDHVDATSKEEAEDFAESLIWWAERTYRRMKATRDAVYFRDVFVWGPKPSLSAEKKLTWFLEGKAAAAAAEAGREEQDRDETLTYGMILDAVHMFSLWVSAWDFYVPACTLTVISDFQGARRPMTAVAAGKFLVSAVPPPA